MTSDRGQFFCKFFVLHSSFYIFIRTFAAQKRCDTAHARLIATLHAEKK
jgi:hypothetical protein